MKKESLTIQIPDPCHEKWSEMTPVEKGRHCKSCDKNVIDFSAMPKSEIVNHLSQHKGRTCGRFSTDQLNVNLISPKPNRSWIKYAALLIGLIPAIGFGQHSEQPNSPIITNQQPIRGKIQMNKIGEFQEASCTLEKSIHVSGKLLDSTTKEVLLFATITIRQGGQIIKKLSTSLEGEYEFNLRASASVEFSYLGYNTLSLDYNYFIKNKEQKILFLEQSMLQGDVIVVGLMVKAPSKPEQISRSLAQKSSKGIHKSESWIKRIWAKFIRAFTYHEGSENTIQLESNSFVEKNSKPQILIFPNPTNGIVKISLPSRIEDGIIQITDMNNSLLKTGSINKPKNEIDISNLQAGSYIVSILSNEKLVGSEVVVKM